MAETLGVRVGRIVSGSVHALIDAVEGAMPDAILQQTLREVDQAVDEVRTELGKTIASRHLASKRLTELSSRHEQLSADIELALGQSRDDLAKAAVESQLDIEAQIPVLESTVADSSAREKELEGYVAALQAKRREMEDGFRALIEARVRGQAEAERSASGTGAARRVENATRAYDRLMAGEGGPGVGAVNREQSGKLAELDRLARQNRVDERLAALRARLPRP